MITTIILYSPLIELAVSLEIQKKKGVKEHGHDRRHNIFLAVAKKKREKSKEGCIYIHISI